MVNTVWVNADHELDVNLLADQSYEISPREKIMIFQHFDFHFS